MASTRRVVAGWILEEFLGAGTFGEVWKAQRPHARLARALKLVRIRSHDAFDSWRHEIDLLESLSHPNVVRFYDADVITDGPYHDHAWIATELCQRSLTDELSGRGGRPLDEGGCDRLLRQMLAALAAADEHGCVHRDLKPANILLHDNGTWKLCDFGTARLVPSDRAHPQTRVVGTLPYMAPWAHHGKQDHAADLYALGVIVHQALCGELLHHWPEGMSDSQYTRLVMDKPATVASELPGHWATVVEVLIGRHGKLNASEIGEWFRTTRGATPPRANIGTGPPTAAPGGGPGPAAATGPGSDTDTDDPWATHRAPKVMLQRPAPEGPVDRPRVDPLPLSVRAVVEKEGESGHSDAPTSTRSGSPPRRIALGVVAVMAFLGGVAAAAAALDREDDDGPPSLTSGRRTATTSTTTVAAGDTAPPEGAEGSSSNDVVSSLYESIWDHVPNMDGEAEAECVAETIVDAVGEHAVVAAGADYWAVYLSTSPAQDDEIAVGVFNCTDTSTDRAIAFDVRWPGPWVPHPSPIGDDPNPAELMAAFTVSVYDNTPDSLDQSEARCIAETIVDAVGEDAVTAAGADYRVLFRSTSNSQDEAIAARAVDCTDAETDEDLDGASGWPSAWLPRRP